MNKSKTLEDYHSKLKTTRILILETNKLKENILIGDFNDSLFFSNKNSEPEKKFSQLNHLTNQHINFLLNAKITDQYQLQWKVNEINLQLKEYKKIYYTLINLYKLKGYRDFGIEGKMRDFAHAIYDFDNNTVKLFCLKLRRHEKDFLMRKDPIYVHQFDKVVLEFNEFLNQSKSLSQIDKNQLIRELYQYNKTFKLLAEIEMRIGFAGKNGYLDRSKIVFDRLAELVEDMDNELILIKQDHKVKFEKNSYSLVFILVSFLGFTIIVLTQLITKSVKTISSSFTRYINSGFNLESVSLKKSNIKEFNTINISFLKMAKEINLFTNFFREKVHERTLAINEQKEEILIQQLKIEEQYNVLLTKNQELNVQKRLLAVKNNHVQESLRYAKRIQKALQPHKTKLLETFPDSFVFSKAKDVVSGDFYLIYKASVAEGFVNNRIVLIASDCTGHGVPGAIMSVLGINTLYKNVKELKNSDPGHILNLLDKDLNQVLAHEKTGDDIVADGMDIGVFSFDKETYFLEYSIAKFAQFLVRNNEIIPLTVQKSTIGYNYFDNEKTKFQTSTVHLEPGDCLYVFSDGLQDQFGGPKNKKFKKGNIKALIESYGHLPMKEQKSHFKEEFLTWKKRLRQTDDVLVIGIRF